MKYDFDIIIPRRGTNSYKWDTPEEENVLPMWVADMDFRTAPTIVEALQKRIAHGIFGYTKVPKAYYDAVIRWFDDRHRWQIDPRWIIYTNGVVPALSAIIKALAAPSDKIIVQTPAYNCFYSSIRNNGCELSANYLVYRDGRYTIDFDDLETKAADPKAKILLLCNPHNPVGRVWTPEELWRIGDICLHNGVFVVADEIHCELVYEGHDYTPFASLSERFRQNSVTCVSPSKAFNLAGLQIANIIAADEGVRRRIDRAININEVCDVNPFGVIATIAAYNEGGAWLDALRKYLWENYEYLCKSRKTKCDGREKRKAIFEAKTKCAQKSRLLPPSGQNTSVVQTPFESCLNDAFLLNFLLKYHLKPIANLAKIVSLHSSYAASLYSVPSAFLNSMMSV